MRLAVLVGWLVGLAGVPSWAAPSVGILVETSSGSSSLAEGIEAVLEEQEVRVVEPAEVRAAVRFFDFASPVDDENARRLLRELGMDSLVIVSSKRSGRSQHFVMVRAVNASAVSRRFAAASTDTFESEVVGMIRAMPIVPAAASPAISTATPSQRATQAGAVKGGTPFRWKPPPEPDRAQFGRHGSFEIGIQAGYSNGHDRERVQGDESRFHSSNLILRPLVGYFVANRIELLVALGLQNTTYAYTGGIRQSVAGLSAEVGSAFLFSMDSLRAGPYLMGGLVAVVTKYEEPGYYPLNVNDSGNVLRGGFVAKLPIGTSALFSADVHFFQEFLRRGFSSGNLRAHGHAWRSGLEVTVGFSFWHRGKR